MGRLQLRRAAVVVAAFVLLLGLAPASPAGTPTDRSVRGVLFDDFSDPIDFTNQALPVSLGPISTFTMTTEPGEPIPSCVTAHGYSAWYRYSPAEILAITADTFGSNYDTVVAVYEDDWNTPVTCNDDAHGTTRQSEVAFTARPGHRYYFQISAYGSRTGDSLVFNVSGTPEYVWWDDGSDPAWINDPLPYNSGGNTTTATTRPGEPKPCNLAHSNSVWWAYSPNASRTVTIDTSRSNYDTVLAVYAFPGAEVACNDDVDSIDPTSEVTFTADVGQTYFIQVSSRGANSGGGTSLFLNVTEAGSVGPVFFDDIADARRIVDPLPYGGGPFDTTFATVAQGEPNPCAAAHNNSVWFSYTPNATATLTVDTHGSNYDTALAVYTSGWADRVACNIDYGAGLTSQTTFDAVAGTTYYIQVSSFGWNSNGGTRLFLNLFGQSAAYECNGEAATIVGTPGKDVILGTPGDDVVVALGGNDVIRTFGGADTVCAGPGRDKVFTGAGPDAAFGEDGNDLILTGGGGDLGYGGRGNDVIRCKGGRDECAGDAGDDEVYAGNGNDWVWGGPGDDVLYGGAGYDWMRGGPGADQCYTGEDVIC